MQAKSGQPVVLYLALTGASAAFLALGVLVGRGWIDRPQPVQVVQFPLDSTIKVAVRGAVNSPGVFTLRDGDRVEDALRAAGGLTSDAEERAINPAARVADAQEIWVPRRIESTAVPAVLPIETVAAAPSPASAVSAPAVRPPAAPAAGRVNLNTATAAQLVALPGIAELTAGRIIESREKVGPFRRIEELRERGIMNERNFELVRERITAP
ncbi:MAG: ComEA family DNA-binding protein [Dehalococcoidia bacterium]